MSLKSPDDLERSKHSSCSGYARAASAGRANKFQDLLIEIIHGCPNGQEVVRGLTLKDVTSPSNQTLNTQAVAGSNTTEDQDATRTGGLTETDIKRFTAPCTHEFDISAQTRIAEELDSIILFVSEFFHGVADSDLTDDKRLEKAWNIPDDIQAYCGGLASDKKELASGRDQMQQLVTEINDIHPRLHEELIHLLSTFPSILNGERSASNDLLATTIEISLIKLALIRARAHQSLYNYKSQNSPRATMAQALSTVYEKLKKDERKMEEEQHVVDRQLDEYQRLLQLVDGSGGGFGFGQVVEDWTRVQKETEECKRDLRRLGWTGD